MPRSQNVYLKRRFKGNQHTPKQSEKNVSEESGNKSSSVNNPEQPRPSSNK